MSEVPTEAEYEAYRNDEKELIEPLGIRRSNLTHAWCLEYLVTKTTPDEKELEPLDRLLKQCPGYVPYLRAIVHFKKSRTDRQIVAAEMIAALENGILKTPARKVFATNVARKTAVEIWSEPVRSEWLRDAVSKDCAALCYRLLTPLDFTGLDANEQLILLMAAAQNDIWPETMTPHGLIAEFIETHFKAPSQKDRFDAVCLVYKDLNRRLQANRRDAYLPKTAALMCNLVNGVLTEPVAMKFFQILKQTEEKTTGIGSPTVSAEDLLSFYTSAGRFIRDHKDVISRAIRCEFLVKVYGKAIRIAEAPSRPPASDPTERSAELAELYLCLADEQRTRYEMLNSNVDKAGIIQDIKANFEKCVQWNPKHWEAHDAYAEWLENLYLSGAARVLDNLNKAVEQSELACNCAPDDAKRAQALKTKSCVCLVRANYSQENRAAYLNSAKEAAEEAIRMLEFTPNLDHPYLALANALEDIAWLVEQEPDKIEPLYEKAILNFENALEQYKSDPLKKAEIDGNIGRCYYKMAYESWLYPGFRDTLRDTENKRKRDNKLRQSFGKFNDAIIVFEKSPDQAAAKKVFMFAKAYYERGNLYLSLPKELIDEAKGRYLLADGDYERAMAAAKAQQNPDLPIFRSAWARLPLRTPWEDNAEAAKFWAAIKDRYFKNDSLSRETLADKECSRRQKLLVGNDENNIYGLDVLKVRLQREYAPILSGQRQATSKVLSQMELDWKAAVTKIEVLEKAKVIDSSNLSVRFLKVNIQFYLLGAKSKNGSIDNALCLEIIANADDVAKKALWPKEIAEALFISATAHGTLFKNNVSPDEHFEKATKKLKEAIGYCPRSPEAADRAYVCARLIQALPQFRNNPKFILEAIEMYKCFFEWTGQSGPANLSRTQDELIGIIKIFGDLDPNVIKANTPNEDVREAKNIWAKIYPSNPLTKENQLWDGLNRKVQGL